MLPQKKDMGILALQIANFTSNQLPITGGERSVDGSAHTELRTLELHDAGNCVLRESLLNGCVHTSIIKD